ncbi:MAG: lipoate--protein ligase, partial [Ruminococcaceae bacterium]|nr:lipoate--protein ligase [Oscillospiraceae bacterium]
MIHQLKAYCSETFDPHFNLATEQYLLESVQGGECILYLWQNQNTVVIGRNQNPWSECKTSLLESEGGHLIRRLSGGGAVFHDLGNLNFTFLVPTEDYDLDKQLGLFWRL